VHLDWLLRLRDQADDELLLGSSGIGTESCQEKKQNWRFPGTCHLDQPPHKGQSQRPKPTLPECRSIPRMPFQYSSATSSSTITGSHGSPGCRSWPFFFGPEIQNSPRKPGSQPGVSILALIAFSKDARS